MDVGLPEAADGELDPGQGRAQVVGDRAEDGGAHGVALGQAQHFPPAGHQLLAFQLGRQVHAERREEPPVAGRQDPSVEDQPGGGVDLFDVVAGRHFACLAADSGWNFAGGGLRRHRRSGVAPPSVVREP